MTALTPVPDTLRHRIRVRIDNIDCWLYAATGRLPVIRRKRELQYQVDDLAEYVRQLGGDADKPGEARP